MKDWIKTLACIYLIIEAYISMIDPWNDRRIILQGARVFRMFLAAIILVI